MNINELLNIATLATGKSRSALTRDFYRKKLKWKTMVVKKYIEVSQLDARKEELISQMQELSCDNVSDDT